MNREERAKQFMPFDALKGLREELLLRERMALRAPRRELFEEEAERLSAAILALTVGKSVELLVYQNGHYLTLTGEAVCVDTAFSRLTVLRECEKFVIPFGDIYRVREV